MLRQIVDSRKITTKIAIGVLLLDLLSSCAPYPVLQPTDIFKQTAEQTTIEPNSTANPYPGPSETTLTPSPQETQMLVSLETLFAQATTAVFEFTASPYPTSAPGSLGIHEGDEYTKLEMLKIGLQVENSWGGVVEGDKVSVWAGALASDSTQGVVHVIYIYPYRTWEVQFLTVEKHGSLHISAEQSNRLELTAFDGSILYFDVPGLTFTSSFDEVISTATPPPTYTPLVFPTQASTLPGYPPLMTPMPPSVSP